MATEETVAHEDSAIEGRREISSGELKSITEALIFVADEPINTKTIADVIDVDREVVEKAVAELGEEYDARASGLQLREIAGGWQIATRPEHHENVRAYLTSKEFLIQFGLKDLSELPSVEDFQDLAGGTDS